MQNCASMARSRRSAAGRRAASPGIRAHARVASWPHHDTCMPLPRYVPASRRYLPASLRYVTSITRTGACRDCFSRSRCPHKFLKAATPVGLRLANAGAARGPLFKAVAAQIACTPPLWQHRAMCKRGSVRRQSLRSIKRWTGPQQFARGVEAARRRPTRQCRGSLRHATSRHLSLQPESAPS